MLVCGQCHGRLSLSGGALSCPKHHTYPSIDGVFDLWPEGKTPPAQDVFSGPYGLIYDAAIKERWLPRLLAPIGWGARVDAMFRLMDDGVRAHQDEVVLDVPVGGGPALRTAAGRMNGTYVGLDLSIPMLRRAHGVAQAEGLDCVVLARADAAHLPVADASVDRVLCFNGLHVMPDKEGVLSEFWRVLKPGGEVWGSAVAIDPESPYRRPWFNLAWWFFHPVDEGDLELAAYSAGFQSWTQERTGSLLTFVGRR